MKTYTLKAANQHRRTSNPIVPRGGPLDNGQKARLCMLAAEGYALQFTDQPLADWRREQQHAAVGKASLRDCVQADYRRLVAHFQRLAGEEGEALRSETAAALEPVMLARRKLAAELASRGLQSGYAEAICRRQYKRGLHEASAKQLWCLVFTVRNRRAIAA